MHVSGNEEHGATARQSSNSSAGVPIKKRRFQLVQHRSPPAEEPSSTLPGENDSLQKELTKSSEESSIPNACVATNSPVLSDANKNAFSDEKKGSPADTNVNSVQNNVKLSGVKLEEPGLTICTGSMDKVDSNDKCLNNSKNTELQLKCNEPLALGVGEEMLSSRETEGVYGFGHAYVPGNTELSLGPKERSIPALAGQNSEGNSRVPVKLDPSPLCLLLGNEKTFTQPESDDVNSNHHNSHLPTNRSNWDLNTTMDDWEGSVGDAPAGHGNLCFSGLSESGVTHDMKIGVGVDSGKQVLDSTENRSILFSSLNANRLCRSDDSLRLRLSTPYLQSNFIGEQSGVSAKEDSGGVVVPSSNLLGVLMPSGKIDHVGRRTVKSEPPGHNPKLDFVGGKSTSLRLFDLRMVKHELVERPCLEVVNMSTFNTQKSAEHRSVKSEPVLEVNQEMHNATEGTLTQSDGKVLQSQDNCSSTTALTLSPKKLCPSVLRSCSTELCISAADVSNQSEYTTNTKEAYINTNVPQEAFVNSDQVASDTVCLSVAREGKTSNECDGVTDVARVEGVTADDPERCRLKLMVEPSLNVRGNVERTVSDDEKINISADMQEEDSFSTGADYESDGDHAVFAPMDIEDRQYGGEDDDYEDGEVRETVHTAVEGHIGERESGNVNVGDLDTKNVDSFGLLGDGGVAQFPVDGNGTRVEDCSRTDDDQIKECVDTVFIEKSDQNLDRVCSLQESQTLQLVGPEPDEKRLIKATQSRPLDRSGLNGDETEVSSDGATNGSQGTITTVGACDGIIKGNDTGEKNDSTLPKTEASLNANDTAKDANNGGNRSRIITLPRASNVSDPCKTRSIPDRSFPSRIGRERYNDFEGDKLHPRGNRDEIYIGGPRKFLRERFQDRSLRNPRLNFMRGRGRGSSHSGALRGGWNPDRDFTSEPYNDRADYRFPRHKRAPDNANAELECNGYMVTEDSDILGSGRGGRKPLNDELPSFRHPSSRRRSPGSRDGPATRGIQMIRRLPRNISPSEDGSDVVGLRHDDKFSRGMPDDIRDPEFTRPQPPYERVDRQFVRGNRNFSSVQRRGLPRIRSKSPIRSRTRSPGPWSSPRRRSPDGFNGSPELTLRRSPAIYRIERMRSPDHPCFAGERVARRHGSPPYVPRPSNNMREMDPGRDHGHPRSVIQNRSSDRVLPRSTRRFDMLDSRERTDSDEYFVGPMQSGRFHEFGGDGSGDERRKCGERRVPVRSFRPPYNGADDGNFRVHVEDGPRPFRFSREADPEFLERSNLRKREFDRRMKSQQLNAPRRTRSIEEQEGNYRNNNGQVWNDDGFDDMSRGKRRRF